MGKSSQMTPVIFQVCRKKTHQLRMAFTYPYPKLHTTPVVTREHFTFRPLWMLQLGSRSTVTWNHERSTYSMLFMSLSAYSMGRHSQFQQNGFHVLLDCCIACGCHERLVFGVFLHLGWHLHHRGYYPPTADPPDLWYASWHLSELHRRFVYLVMVLLLWLRCKKPWRLNILIHQPSHGNRRWWNHSSHPPCRHIHRHRPARAPGRSERPVAEVRDSTPRDDDANSRRWRQKWNGV